MAVEVAKGVAAVVGMKVVVVCYTADGVAGGTTVDRTLDEQDRSLRGNCPSRPSALHDRAEAKRSQPPHVPPFRHALRSPSLEVSCRRHQALSVPVLPRHKCAQPVANPQEIGVKNL